MDDSEPAEIHPLDRDYSDDANESPKRKFGVGKLGRHNPTARKSQLSSDVPYAPKLRTFGAWGLLGGMLVLFLSSVAVSNAPPNSPSESIAGGINRISMFVMLIGGLAIVVAYRLPHLQGHVSSINKPKRPLIDSTFRSLLFWNVIGYIAIALLVAMSTFLTPGGMLLGAALSTMLFAYCASLAFCSTGIMRTYGIAVVAAMIFNLQFGSWAAAISYSNQSILVAFMVNFAIILGSGLFCAAVVGQKKDDPPPNE